MGLPARRERLNQLEIAGRGSAVAALLQLVLDALTFGEAREPRAFDCRDMHEHVL